MGERYQNKLDEEAEREYWANAPWWHKILYWVGLVCVSLLVFWGAIGWWLVKLFGF